MVTLAAWLVLCLMAYPVLSQQPPATMTKISVRLIAPATTSGSFAAQPKTFWRAGTKYARIVESPDPETHIQGLVIISEPDAWMVNLSDKSGRHVVDSGPSLVVHLPIFNRHTGEESGVNELEFGTERDFFAKHSATRLVATAIDGTPADRFEATIGKARVTLWTDAKSKKPLRVSLSDGNESEVYQYLSYDDEIPFDPLLFQPPSGIHIQEVK